MTRTRAGFEVLTPFLQLADSEGHQHWLGSGADLPTWVSDDQIGELIESRIVQRYEVI